MIEAQTGDAANRVLLAEVFHALSQPLTSLRCSLELAEQRTHELEEYRDLLRGTRDQVEEVAALISGLRQWLEAGDPGDQRQVLALGVCLQEVVQDLLPLAQARGIRLRLRYRSLPAVRAEAHRFRQAVFCLLECALSGAGREALVSLEAMTQADGAVLELSTSPKAVAADLSGSPGRKEKIQRLLWHLALGAATRSLEAAGGRVQMQEHEGQWSVRVWLPLARG